MEREQSGGGRPLEEAARKVAGAVQQALLDHFNTQVDSVISQRIASDVAMFFAAKVSRGDAGPSNNGKPLEYRFPARTAQEIKDTPAALDSVGRAQPPRVPSGSITQRIRQHQAQLQKPVQPSPGVDAPAPRPRTSRPRMPWEL